VSADRPQPFSTIFCLGLPVLRRHAVTWDDLESRPEELENGLDWCRHNKGGQRDRRRRRIVSDRSCWSVRDRTTSLETKSVQWIWRIRLRHQLSNASIFFAKVQVTDQTS